MRFVAISGRIDEATASTSGLTGSTIGRPFISTESRRDTITFDREEVVEDCDSSTWKTIMSAQIR